MAIFSARWRAETSVNAGPFSGSLAADLASSSGEDLLRLAAQQPGRPAVRGHDDESLLLPTAAMIASHGFT
jgi:hypothetical protein